MAKMALSALAGAVMATAPISAGADEHQELWLPSLITETPQAGFDLAVQMARRAVVTTQPDVAKLQTLRPTYARDADSLIHVSEVAAAWFSTIAAANDYWRE